MDLEERRAKVETAKSVMEVERRMVFTATVVDVEVGRRGKLDVDSVEERREREKSTPRDL
jgi:hypothetical protein